MKAPNAEGSRLTVGRTARLAEIGIATMRFYERAGLLPKPTRTTANYRLYPDEAVTRIRFIRRAQQLGFTLMYLVCIQISHCADQTEVPAPRGTRTFEAGRVSFYEVPLVCPAAPQIGCGSASKPLLLELERSDQVSEAWLNRAGTRMAVVWREQSKPRQRSKTLKAILKQRGVTAKELTGNEKEQAVASFKSGRDWYRGSDVDRLSEEEAGVIANRWIGKFREKIDLTDAKARALQEAFTAQLKRHLTGRITREEAKEEMLRIARQHLDEKDVAVLLEAFGSGFRPNN